MRKKKQELKDLQEQFHGHQSASNLQRHKLKGPTLTSKVMPVHGVSIGCSGAQAESAVTDASVSVLRPRLLLVACCTRRHPPITGLTDLDIPP